MIKTIKLEKKGLDNIKLLSGAQLKYIAFLSMLIDHVNKALIYPILDGGLLLEISDFFDVIGRIAFPLFAFLKLSSHILSLYDQSEHIQYQSSQKISCKLINICSYIRNTI